MSVPVSAVTGPWGVQGILDTATGNVALHLLYRLVTGGGVVLQWIVIEAVADEVLVSLDPTDEPRVADALTALGYELP